MLVYIYVALQKWQNQVAKWHYDIQKKCQCDRQFFNTNKFKKNVNIAVLYCFSGLFES